jgi:hypothetical protein
MSDQAPNQINAAANGPSARRDMALLLIGAVVFGIAHTQSPLYFSNQHQYFVHGIAAAGAGTLSHDWLANTLDPTPAFSACVAFTARHLHVWLFHLLYLAILGAYFVSLMSIGASLVPDGRGRRRALFALGSMLIVIHSGIVRLASVQWFGVDYPWYFQCGVANQYVLGPGLQPSAFGAFLVASVAAFVRGRLIFAVVFSSMACLVHATYLLPAASLTLTYMLMLRRDGRARAALQVGAATLLAVLPVVVYSAWAFAPTSPQMIEEAERIIAEFRIPHHALIRRWLGPIDGLQIAWMALAVALCPSRLRILLGVPLLLSTALTLAQAATGNLMLALLFPWRISSVLMPIATCVILARLASRLPNRPWAPLLWLAAAILALAGGGVIQIEGLAYHMNESELPALEFVRDHKGPDDIYLIPVRIPSVEGARGSKSTSFMPPPRGQDKHLIVVDFQRFRLFAEAPIYVDFKSIPYKDADVLEWRRRLDQCEKWYTQRRWQDADVRDQLRREGITHVVVTADKPIPDEGYEQVYADDFYRIYRLR